MKKGKHYFYFSDEEIRVQEVDVPVVALVASNEFGTGT